MKVEATTIVAPNGVNVSNGSMIIKQKQPDYFLSDGQNQNIAGVEPGKNSGGKLGRTIGVANEAFKEVNVAFKYSVDKKTNREIIEIVNAETGEEIRQLPPEEIVNMLSRMYDLLGFLVDQKV
ncbi:MAG TPA: flagellar protein FlaG [Bacillota bacterium]|nr:flagellar protein FlaG [Bacillota bacterium]